MKIGIDIDNCISNFNDTLLEEYLKHDKELRNTGIINEKSEYLRKGMFDWTEEEEKSFYNKNIESFAKKLKPIKDSVYYIKKLKEDGHQIYIITGRNNGEYTDPYQLTEEWLNKYDIIYDKLIFTDAYNKHEKTEICLENNIDLMIEDSTSISLDLIKHGIKVFTMNTIYNQKEQTLDRVSTWKEIYERISKFNPKEDNTKINVILDTDTYNECDDQVALAYLLKYRDKFNIEAITIAPFQNHWIPSDDSGIELSYQEAKKVCNLSGVNSNNLIFKGSTNYISKGYKQRNDAVNKIIEIALKNEKTYILGIGAITNIALAIEYEPKIVDKIEVIWLGGHTLLHKNNLHEANFKDIEAIKIVYKSDVKLTVIPARGVASNLYTTTYELEKCIKGKNELCDFLYYTIEKIANEREILPRWRLWDIAVIAYIVNKNWFETFETPCPDINNDTSYRVNTNNREITMVNYLEVCEIYKDLFEKLGE